jgi:hypothetical protein
MSGDGIIRVLVSDDNLQWTEAATLSHPDGDLREVHASVAPDGRLLFHGAVRMPDGKRFRALVWESTDGETWTNATRFGPPDEWIWRVRWHKEIAYGVAYTTNPRAGAHLLRSQDGLSWERWVENLVADNLPSEANLLFLPDDRAVCLVRRDGERNTTLLGVADPPYREWRFSDTGTVFHSPVMVRLDCGTLLAGGRLLEPERTALCTVDVETATLHEVLTLPSGDDNAYPALVLHDGLLWVCYYSSHEDQTNIYLAQIEID